MNIEKGLVDALRIAGHMKLSRERLKRAVESGDKDEVVRSACYLLGMEDPSEEGDRPAPGVERGAGRR